MCPSPAARCHCYSMVHGLVPPFVEEKCKTGKLVISLYFIFKPPPENKFHGDIRLSVCLSVQLFVCCLSHIVAITKGVACFLPMKNCPLPPVKFILVVGAYLLPSLTCHTCFILRRECYGGL